MHQTPGIFALLVIFCCLWWMLRVRCSVDYRACNENLCGSHVSYCLLTKACACEDFATNQHCASNCTKCLNYLYQDCCSCLGLCVPTIQEVNPLKQSNVELIDEPDTEMFVIMSHTQPIRETLWRMENFTYKVQLFIPDLSDESHRNAKTVGVDQSNGNKPPPAIIPTDVDIEVNCTVAFLAQCMSMNKCKQNCEMMGASAYRWFHNACCHCVGSCEPSPFGESQARCELCLEEPKMDSTAENQRENAEEPDDMSSQDQVIPDIAIN